MRGRSGLRRAPSERHKLASPPPNSNDMFMRETTKSRVHEIVDFFAAFWRATPHPIAQIVMLALSSALVAVLNDSRILDAGFRLGSTSGRALQTILAFLIVFRTNQSYNRWWEGRILWGKMHWSCVDLTQQASAWIDDKELARRIMNFSIAFAYTVKQVLRREQVFAEDLEGIVGAVEVDRINNLSMHVRPYYCTEVIRQCTKKGLTESPQKHGSQAVARGIDIPVSQLSVQYSDMARVRNTPQPDTFRVMLHMFTLIYLLLLPMLSYDALGYYVIVEVLLTSYLMLGLQIAADMLEDPFGHDQTDLELDLYVANVATQCRAAFLLGEKNGMDLTVEGNATKGNMPRRFSLGTGEAAPSGDNITRRGGGSGGGGGGAAFDVGVPSGGYGRAGAGAEARGSKLSEQTRDDKATVSAGDGGAPLNDGRTGGRGSRSGVAVNIDDDAAERNGADGIRGGGIVRRGGIDGPGWSDHSKHQQIPVSSVGGGGGGTSSVLSTTTVTPESEGSPFSKPRPQASRSPGGKAESASAAERLPGGISPKDVFAIGIQTFASTTSGGGHATSNNPSQFAMMSDDTYVDPEEDGPGLPVTNPAVTPEVSTSAPVGPRFRAGVEDPEKSFQKDAQIFSNSSMGAASSAPPAAPPPAAGTTTATADDTSSRPLPFSNAITGTIAKNLAIKQRRAEDGNPQKRRAKPRPGRGRAPIPQVEAEEGQRPPIPLLDIYPLTPCSPSGDP